MWQSTAAVLAAAASASLIVAFVPASKLDTGRGQAAIDRSLSDGSRVSALPLESTATGTMPRASVEDDPQNSEAEPGTACAQSWPYYERSCLHNSNPSNPIRVVVADRSPAAPAEETRR